jgi:transposase
VELYAASDAYPLARRIVLLGGERGYLQHAATAIVLAGSGQVRLLASPTPDAVTASWRARFPSLFVAPGALSPELLAALPPVTDGAVAQALAFASAGFRRDSLEVRHLAVPDGADSAASREPVRVVLPGLGLAALWPLLDTQERVRGVVAAVGGSARGTSWIPVVSDDQRWGTVVDRLRAADSTMRERALLHAPVRVVPVGGRAFYLQAAFQWRPGGTPALRHVATLSADTLRSGATFAAALGSPTGAGVVSPARPDLRARAESLYREMRGALGRGDWTAFGRAFDSLGGTLRGRVP